MDNPKIAAALNDVASILEIQDANPFRVRAYRNAARMVKGYSESIAEMVSNGEDLTSLKGIGKDLARHLATLVREEGARLLEELAGDVPVSLLELTHLPGLGAKRVKTLWEELGVTTHQELEAAANTGAVAQLAGFGKKTEEKILESIERYRTYQETVLLGEADIMVLPLLEHLRSSPAYERVEPAGEYRRRSETVRNLRLLAISSSIEDSVEAVSEHPTVLACERDESGEIVAKLKDGADVRIHVASASEFGANLIASTGSSAHLDALRTHAETKGMSVSESGLLENCDKPSQIATGSEEEVYAQLGLQWIPPELRENRGEIEAAASDTLPTLIELEDMKGDLQMHSTWSDGQASLETMLEACAARGYEYFAITDHSKALGIAGGLDAEKLRRQWDEIAELSERHKEIRILRGMEVDILGDGVLDLEDDMLAELDVVLASVHSRFNLPQVEQTERVLKAMQHPQVNILAHPTGRLINRRDPISLDIDAIIDCAASFNVVLELNAHPARLDLSDEHLMRAREKGVKIVISTDAHSVSGLDVMPYGVGQARRAWLEKEAVVNTYGVDEMLNLLKKN